MNADSPSFPTNDPEVRLTALLLGELPATEAAALRAELATNPELARLYARLALAIELTRETTREASVTNHRSSPASDAVRPEPLQLDPARRARLRAAFQTPVNRVAPLPSSPPSTPTSAAVATPPTSHAPDPTVIPVTFAPGLPNPRSRRRAQARDLLALAAMLVALLTLAGVATRGPRSERFLAREESDSLFVMESAPDRSTESLAPGKPLAKSAPTLFRRSLALGVPAGDVAEPSSRPEAADHIDDAKSQSIDGNTDAPSSPIRSPALARRYGLSRAPAPQTAPAPAPAPVAANGVAPTDEFGRPALETLKEQSEVRRVEQSVSGWVSLQNQLSNVEAVNGPVPTGGAERSGDAPSETKSLRESAASSARFGGGGNEANLSLEAGRGGLGGGFGGRAGGAPTKAKADAAQGASTVWFDDAKNSVAPATTTGLAANGSVANPPPAGPGKPPEQPSQPNQAGLGGAIAGDKVTHWNFGNGSQNRGVDRDQASTFNFFTGGVVVADGESKTDSRKDVPTDPGARGAWRRELRQDDFRLLNESEFAGAKRLEIPALGTQLFDSTGATTEHFAKVDPTSAGQSPVPTQPAGNGPAEPLSRLKQLEDFGAVRSDVRLQTLDARKPELSAAPSAAAPVRLFATQLERGERDATDQPQALDKLSLATAQPVTAEVENRSKLAVREMSAELAFQPQAPTREEAVEQALQESRFTTPALGQDKKLADGREVEDEVLKRPAPRPAAPVPQPEVVTAADPFSTFSLNVSAVSFQLAAASLEKGALPDPATIRSEEFLNAFPYGDPEPRGGAALGFAWERARTPFAHDREVLRFSVKTAASGRSSTQPLNLVLLVDNSGSMERADRVRIRSECLRVLASQLGPQDRLSILSFARTARLWADGVAGNEAGELVGKLAALTPEGGTNLEDALALAYQTATRHFQAQGINRVVLLTDGAANLGDVSPETLRQTVIHERTRGIALDCFGIGWDGLDDDLLEQLSRNGDGRYGFLNTPEDAATGFAQQLAGALRVAASDVKVQVEFNPKRVTLHRQVGYARHQLTKDQFRDNTVDAAELGAAEAGTALYVVQTIPAGDGPIATVRARFKVPGTATYEEQEWTVPYEGPARALAQAAPSLRLAAVAGAFSEWLAGSPFATEVTPQALLPLLEGVAAARPQEARRPLLGQMLHQANRLAPR